MDSITKTIQYPNGVDYVHSPALSDEERAGIKQQMVRTGRNLLKSAERVRLAKQQERLEA